MMRPANLANRGLSGLRIAAFVLAASSLATIARGDDAVYLDEPRPEPPPKEMGTIKVPEKYEDGTVRIEREVLRMSDDTFVNDGSFVEYYRDGQKFTEGTFKKGVHDGVWTFWHPNGQLCKKVTFVDGRPDGQWDVFGPDGKLLVQKSYKQGKRHGKWTYYHRDGETPRIAQTYVENQLHGERMTYHANGKPYQRSYFKNGVLDGTLTEWDASGRKVAEVTFKDGARDGQVVTWGPNGERTEQSARPRGGVLLEGGPEKPEEEAESAATQQSDELLRLMNSR